MTHARTQIRDAAATLATGLTTTGANVFKHRLWELEQGNLPAWDVSTSVADAEEAELVAGNRLQVRECRLVFTGVARAVDGDTLADLLDTMAEELETAITKAALTATIGIRGFAYESTEFAEDVDETDQAIGYVILTYLVTYHTTEGAPGAFV